MSDQPLVIFSISYKILIMVTNLCIGGNQDGAYLVPDDFEGIEFLISPGVGDIRDLRMRFIQYGIKSILIGPQIPQAIRVRACYL